MREIGQTTGALPLAKDGDATPTFTVLIFHSVVVVLAAAIPAGFVIGARPARHPLFPPLDVDTGSLVYEGFLALCAVVAILIFGSGYVSLFRKRRRYLLALPGGALAATVAAVASYQLSWEMAPRLWLFVPFTLLSWGAQAVLAIQLICLFSSSSGASNIRRVVREAVRAVMEVFGIYALFGVLAVGTLRGLVFLGRRLGWSDKISAAVAMVGALFAVVGAFAVRRHALSWWVRLRALVRVEPCFLLLRSETAPKLSDTAGFEEPLLASAGPGDLRAPYVSGRSYRVELVRALARLGVPVAVGALRRELAEPSVPIVAFATPDAAWQATVRAVAECARAIIVIPGTSAGVLTELRMLRDEGWWSRSIVVMPPVFTRERAVGFELKIEENRAPMEREWAQIQAALGAKGCAVPAFRPGTAYLPDARLAVRFEQRLPNPDDPDATARLAEALATLLARIDDSGGRWRDVRAAVRRAR